MRLLSAFVIFSALWSPGGAPAFAAVRFRKPAPAKLAAYAVCRSLAIVDMGP